MGEPIWQVLGGGRMMLDRFGKPIRVGWAIHEILWIEAALTLPRAERLAAFEDIASMTGRTVAGVQTRAYTLAAERPAQSDPRTVMVLAVTKPGRPRIPLACTAGSARRCKSRRLEA
jgi:hypothetical protein